MLLASHYARVIIFRLVFEDLDCGFLCQRIVLLTQRIPCRLELALNKSHGGRKVTGDRSEIIDFGHFSSPFLDNFSTRMSVFARNPVILKQGSFFSVK